MFSGHASEHEFSPLESAILKRARAGSDSALGELLQLYRSYLAAIADEELGSDLKVKASTSDLVQESFLEARRDFFDFEGDSPAQFRNWLRRILLNNVANTNRMFRQTERRNLARETRPGDGEISDVEHIAGLNPESPGDQVERLETTSSISAAINKLPEHYRTVILLRNYERASFDEIGKRLEKSPEAIRKLWIRALQALSNELEFF